MQDCINRITSLENMGTSFFFNAVNFFSPIASIKLLKTHDNGLLRLTGDMAVMWRRAVMLFSMDVILGLSWTLGRLSGVMDDRGKYIYISQEEMKAVADYIKRQGRVNISHLASKSNQFIDLEPKVQFAEEISSTEEITVVWFCTAFSDAYRGLPRHMKSWYKPNQELGRKEEKKKWGYIRDVVFSFNFPGTVRVFWLERVFSYGLIG